MVGGEGGAGKDEVVGAVAGEVGVGVAFLVGGMVVVYQPAGEFVEGGGAAGGDVEVAAEEDVVVGGECFADEGVEVAGFGGAAGGAVLDEVYADDVQGLGAGDGNGGPEEAAVEDVGVVPLAVGDDGVAADDAVGKADAAGFAGEVATGAHDAAGKVVGGAEFVVEFLNGDDVGAQGLEDADAGVGVGLGGVVGKVGGGDRDGVGEARGGGGDGGGGVAEGQKEKQNGGTLA